MVRPYHIHVLITLTNNHDMTKIGKNLVVQLITLLKELIAQLFFFPSLERHINVIINDGHSLHQNGFPP